MNCPNCGADNAPESKFCIGCGAPMASSGTPASEKGSVNAGDLKSQLTNTLKPVTSKVKSLWSKAGVRFGVIGGVAALVILLVLAAIFGGSNGFIQVKGSIGIQQSDKEEYSVIVNGKVLKDTIDVGENGSISSTDQQYSMDGKTMALKTSKNELFVVSGNKVISVAEDVASFELSVNGKGIAYTVKEETKDENDRVTETTYELFLYTVSGKKNKSVASDIANQDNIAISPDGKSVLYYVKGEEPEKSDEEGSENSGEKEPDELTFFNGKKSTTITSKETIKIYGLSNGGKQIYVSAKDGDDTVLYVYNQKGDKQKLKTLGSSVKFNAKHTQVIFTDNEGKTHVSTNGKEAVKISSDALTLIIPERSASVGSTYPVNNLFDHVYKYENDSKELTAVLVKKNPEKNKKLISKASYIELDSSAEYLYYIYKGEELRFTKISYGEKASEKYTVVIDEEMSSFWLTSDRKYVYYIDNMETKKGVTTFDLYSVNGKKANKSATEVAEDVTDLAMSNKDRLYYTMDEDLYVTTNNKAGKLIQGDVNSVSSTIYGHIVAQDQGEKPEAIYVSTGSKKVKKILSPEY